MIYFLSDGSQLNVRETDNLKVVHSLEPAFEFIRNNSMVGFDLETNGLDAYKNDILLIGIGNKEIQIIIDCSCNFERPISDIFIDDFFIVGHNLKFDNKFIKVKYGKMMKNLHDTMLAEQRIYQGSGFKWGLIELIKRHFGVLPEAYNKGTRNEFIGLKLSQKAITNYHLDYLSNDLAYLLPIKEKQDVYIDKYNLQFLVRRIEFPLSSVLGQAELDGLDLNKEEWQKLITANEIIKYESEVKMDKILNDLRDTWYKDGETGKVTNDLYYGLVGGVFSQVRSPIKVTENVDLFGGGFETVENINKGCINYSSPTQLIEIFAKFEQPLPTKDNQYLIPLLNKKGKIEKGKAMNLKREIVEFYDTFTTIEGFLGLYLKDFPRTIMKDFILTLIDYREAETKINNFGKNFFDKINPVTGRIHTSFRQCHALTGRLQSGGGKNEPDKINGQNIPAQKAYRSCFYREGYKILTADLSGAELVIICDKAKDTKLLEISKGDMHSYVANRCWKNIYNLRGKEFTDDLVISKKQNEEKRVEFKPMTFGTIYGMYPGKAAKTLNISKPEGVIVIDTIKDTFPMTFQMIEKNVQSVLGAKNWQSKRTKYANPYIILNERTNSRIWFPDVITAKKFNSPLEWMKASEIEGVIANAPIQGTQADMVKEMMVEIDTYIQDQNLDAKLLLQVHDELVYAFKDGLTVCVNSEDVLFETFVTDKMVEVANRYLSFVKMGIDFHVKDTWIK
jgi:DNA polymerase I-like protein with 3'-5' exonuclease and polymerase domains